MKWIGVRLNHNGPDGLDGRYSPQSDLPSIDNGDWHDGPHQYEDGYGDDGQDLVCVLCAQAKRDDSEFDPEEWLDSKPDPEGD